MVALLRLHDIVSPDRVQELQQMLAQDAPNSGLQRAQRQLAQKWFAHSGVPFVELIQWSKGIVNPAPGNSYVTMLGGIVVSATTRSPCSVHPSIISDRVRSNRPAVEVSCVSRTFGCSFSPLILVAHEAHLLQRPSGLSRYRPRIPEHDLW